MAEIYSKRLAGPAQPGLASPTTLFTVPAGSTYRVNEIVLVNEHATTTQNFWFELFDGSSWLPLLRLAVDGASSARQELLVAFEAGEALRARRLVSGVDARVTVDGYAFVGS